MKGGGPLRREAAGEESDAEQADGDRGGSVERRDPGERRLKPLVMVLTPMASVVFGDR
jgi:hypothetical protein